MPDEGFAESDGAFCWTVEPADGSRLVPVPCAFAKPVPAISAAAATDIRKRLVMEYLLACLLARADNERGSMMFRDISGSAELVL
jgi:hypothetical protein